MLLPVTEPVGWNKKTRTRLAKLLDEIKELVQSLNDDFGSYDEQSLKDYLDSIK
jgi:phage-related tail protein